VGALLIAAAIAFIIFMRKRRVGMFAVKLKEPDYMLVAYGDQLNRTPDSSLSNYSSVIQLL